MTPPPTPPPLWSARWHQLAAASGIRHGERLLVALSGGADSVLLLHLLANAVPRPNFRAVHVDHGLRGEESRADARFCANLCRALAVPYTERRLELAPGPPSPEARARRARYAVLVEEALRTDHGTILTGHHSDDVLETLIMRWIRGSNAAGLVGPRAEIELEPNDERASPVRVVRPLHAMRREEVRRLLSDRGLRWREDSSNQDPGPTRNRVRHQFLPELERLCGTEGVENLRAFGRAVESLEDRLAGATAHLAWSSAPYVGASRGPRDARLGGVLRRADLMRLAPLLRRRALWRLLTEGTGRSPSRSLLDAILKDLAAGRCTRHALPKRWILLLRSHELHLLPPAERRARSERPSPREARDLLPFPVERDADGTRHPVEPRHHVVLSVPGIVSLADGRRISAEPVDAVSDAPLPGDAFEAEIDARGLPELFTIRWPERGDRFHALGAPGSKRLMRFLADRGIPREERPSVPLVFAGEEIVWVPGLGPSEGRRIQRDTRHRIRLTLHNPA